MAGRPKTTAKLVMKMWLRYVEVHCDAMRLVPERSRKTERPEKKDTIGCLWYDFRQTQMEAEVILDCLADELCRKAGIPDWSPDELNDDETLDQETAENDSDETLIKHDESDALRLVGHHSPDLDG